MSANRMIVDESTKIIIYGAGLKGEMFYEIAMENRLDVIAFFDKNANSIIERNGIPVINPFEIKLEDKYKKGVLVIVSVNDIFTHEDIAKQLFSIGYRHILYKPNILRKLEDVEKYLSDSFDSFYLDKTILGLKVPEFNYVKNSFHDNIIREQEKCLIVYLPAENLFGLSETEFKKKYKGFNSEMNNVSNCFSYLYCEDLFFGYEHGLDMKLWNDFLEIYHSGSYDYVKQDDNSTFIRHLKNRYKLYQIMSNSMHINPLFFEQSPIMVLQNGKNKLVIKDGANRTAFMLSKNMFWIPCRIDKELYHSLYNETQLKQLNEYLINNNIMELLLPISHPYFCGFMFKYDVYAQKLLYSICQKIRLLGKTIMGKRFLDVNACNGFYSQFFANNDCKVLAIEEDEKMIYIFRQINRLLKCEDIEIRSVLDETCGEYDFAFVHNLDDNAEKFHDTVHALKKMKLSMLFIEIVEGGICERIFNECEQYGAEIVCRFVFEDKVMKTLMVRKYEE